MQTYRHIHAVTLALVLLAAVGTAGCTSMLTGSGGSSAAPLGSESRSAEQQQRDSDLQRTVAQALASESGLQGLGLSVTAHNNTVTVSGAVPSFSLRDRAIVVARNAAGSALVRNQIRVERE